jgi:hypothetical protein
MVGDKLREKQVFWTTTGIALFIGLFMNVFTGIELTVAIHMGRFVVLWALIVLGVVLSEWYISHAKAKSVLLYARHGAVSVFVLLLMVGAVNNIPRALSFFEFNDRGYDIGELQSYDGPLSWMEDTIETPTVIWANISLSAYVPVQTKHYVLFHNSATLHMVPLHELEERYLLWKTLDSVTVETLKQEFDMYAGAGPVKEQPLAQNNYAKYCPKLKQLFSGMGECPQKTDTLTLRGDTYFEELYTRYTTVRANREMLLQKYGVTHVIVDTRSDAYSQGLSRKKALYDDGRYLIFNTKDILTI